ncbi:NAD(P)H-dependent oxidoreductase [Streptomyces sp. MN03-5084-2B]|nr:NAD(P)H-dependent oxidoreductase [Streptomyces sp. MN03-5084-2B]
MSTRILVVYYSSTGNTAGLAGSLAAGAREAGADVRVRTVPETVPAEAIARNPRWQAWVDAGPHHELATLGDLEWADGLAVGSPTRFGGPAAQLKSYLDSTGGLWAQGKLADKVATSFTTASTAHGGLESTLLAINNVFYHWGAIVVPLGYTDRTSWSPATRTAARSCPASRRRRTASRSTPCACRGVGWPRSPRTWRPG